MSTFALPPLRLPFPNIRAVQRPLPKVQPAADPVQQAADLDESCRPVPASSRDLTIPDVVPPQRSSWRRPLRIRGRES
ncbi:hypothetical protein ACFFGH_28925 [Lysobacter korlensis]|uniref:Uncharacterized protein n=1 Tax=Lysobacter korlensis TaxID=553636 RepID=A0ABV6RY16_9GAMM